MDFAAAYFHYDGAGAFAVLNYEGQQKPLFVDAHARFHHLFVQHMQQRLPGEIGYEECARLALSAECARAKPSFVVAVEYDAHMLH